MNFNIEHPPTEQDLSNMDSTIFQRRRSMILRCVLGFFVSYACMLWASTLSTANPVNSSTIVQFIMFARLYSLGFVVFGIVYWFFKDRLSSDPLTSEECRSLLSSLNHKSRAYVKMVNQQCRQLSYFDYSLIMKWHFEEATRKAQDRDACVTLHSI